MARPCPDRLPEQVDDVRLCHRRNRFRQRVLYLGVGDVVGVGRQRQYIGRPRVSNRVDLAAIGDCDPGTDDALTAIRRGHGVAFASSAQARGCVVVKILMIVVVIAIVAGAYWLIRRSVLRDEPASRQRLERRREAWRAGGASGRRRAYTAAATAAAALAAEVATGGGGSDGGGGGGD